MPRDFEWLDTVEAGKRPDQETDPLVDGTLRDRLAQMKPHWPEGLYGDRGR